MSSASPQSPLASRLDTAAWVVTRILEGLLILVMAAMLAGVAVQVSARYVLDTSAPGSGELARIAMTTGTFLAIPVLTYRGQHIVVTALHEWLPSNSFPQRLVRGLALIGEAVFLGIFAWFAVLYTVGVHGSGQSLVALQIPLSWAAAPVAIGSGLGAVMALLVLTAWLLNGAPGIETVSDDVTGNDATSDET